MVRYCQWARCRTHYILDYFGEDVDAEWECGHCDNCLRPLSLRGRESGIGIRESVSFG